MAAAAPAYSIEFHFGPHAKNPDPEAVIETMTWKSEGRGGPLYVGDWRTQEIRPFATVTWADGLSSAAWYSLREAKAIAALLGAKLVRF